MPFSPCFLSFVYRLQEAIKLLTRQLVPLPAGGPLIYNAIEATTHTFSL